MLQHGWTLEKSPRTLNLFVQLSKNGVIFGNLGGPYAQCHLCAESRNYTNNIFFVEHSLIKNNQTIGNWLPHAIFQNLSKVVQK